MKKIMAAMLAALLVLATLSLWGCGDDDPVDPPDACGITVTSPAAGDTYRPGDVDHNTMNIRWNKSGDADLASIELLKSGSLVGTIHPSTPNNGFYRWTASNFGAANGSDFAIRVTANGENGCFDVSDQFTMLNTVGCSLDFTNSFPDTLFAGEVFPLTWSSTNTTGHVDIQLRRQDQNLALIANRIADDGSFNWTVDSYHNGTLDGYFLRIMDSELGVCFADSVTFTIVDEDICFIDIATPSEGTIWFEGNDQNIVLAGSPEVTHVDLRLYTGSIFVPGGYIVSDYPVDELPYTWNVRDFGNTQGTTMYRIRAINSDDEYCVGISGAFTIFSE